MTGTYFSWEKDDGAGTFQGKKSDGAKFFSQEKYDGAKKNLIWYIKNI